MDEFKEVDVLPGISNFHSQSNSTILETPAAQPIAHSETVASPAPVSIPDDRQAASRAAKNSWKLCKNGGLSRASVLLTGNSTPSQPPLNAHSTPESSGSIPQISRAEARRLILCKNLRTQDLEALGLMRDGALSINAEPIFGKASEASSLSSLTNILAVMSRSVEGLTLYEVSLASRIFGSAIERVADISENPAAVRAAAKALTRSECISVDCSASLSGHPIQYNQFRDYAAEARNGMPVELHLQSTTDVSVTRMQYELLSLAVGEHSLYHFSTINSFNKRGHATALSFTKLPQDSARVSIVNAADQIPGDFMDVPVGSVLRNLDQLFSPTAIVENMAALENTPLTSYILDGHEATSILQRAWIRSLDPQKPPRQNYFGAEDHRQRSQKTGDCGIEAQFAFLSTVLPRHDYKLSKAACIRTMIDLGDETGILVPALKGVLEDRFTSAVNGMTTELDRAKFSN